MGGLVFRAAIAASAKVAFVGALIANGSIAAAQVIPDDISNFEYGHVTPLALVPGQDRLLAVNTPNGSIESFSISGNQLTFSSSVKVGLEPVSVRPRTSTEAWVVNALSDSVSIVDLSSNLVTQTLNVCDQPADVVFAGSPQKAFVSCAGAEKVVVYDAENPTAPVDEINILGEQPRAMTVSPDGSEIYLAIFESGNGTTALTAKTNRHETDLVNSINSPYGGVNPPPNNGTVFNPPLNPNIEAPSSLTSMIVRRTPGGDWLDDNGVSWRTQVTGGTANAKDRLAGWDLIDRDIAVIDVASHDVSYKGQGLNIVMGLAVHPTSGQVTAVGTDATNEVRFEPVINGKFLRVLMATYGANDLPVLSDLNPHLDYSTPRVPASEREKSLGDPRAIAWTTDGSKAVIAGMGSNNVVIVNSAGARVGISETIEVGEGPTGIVLDGDTAFVFNRFDASISTLDLTTEAEVSRTSLSIDPTPQAIKDGRFMLYDTHLTSGTGHVSCGSCHVDSRTDRLAWDLGNPAGEMEIVAGNEHHPMKGPLLTQTLVDTMQSPFLHWRGDKENLAHFQGAFVTLQGMEEAPSLEDMAKMEAFLATTRTPPNPFRNLDNTYSNAVDIRGPGGVTLRTGDAEAGAVQFENGCRRCHPGNTGRGDTFHKNFVFSGDNFLNPPRWQNFYLRDGLFFTDATDSTTGFGFQQDGTFDSTHNDTRNNNMMAFMYSFNGSFPYDAPGLNETNEAVDAHAAVGRQVTLSPDQTSSTLLDEMVSIAATGAIEMTAHACVDGETRGFLMAANTAFTGDVSGSSISLANLAAMATDGPVTFTAVRTGTGRVFALDENGDGVLNGDANTAGRVCGDAVDNGGGGPMAQLIVNGDFDAPVVPAGGWRPVTNVEGWTNVNGQIEVWRGLFGIVGPDGEETLMELDRNGGGQPDAVSQTLASMAGDRVQLDFSYAARTGTPISSNAFDVLWNGEIIATFAPEGDGTWQDIDGFWHNASFALTAVGNDVVTFREHASANNGAGTLITGVSATVLDDATTTTDMAVNGNFDSPIVPAGGWRATTNVEGWTNVNGAIEVWRGLFGLEGPNGEETMMELDVRGGGSVDAISQTFAETESGAAVEINFAFAGRPNTAAATNAFDVFWNGSLVASFTPEGNGVFDQASLNVQAIGNDVLTFQEWTGTSNGLGALITGVEVLVTQ